MTAHAIASKFRQALRNGTGVRFSQEQLQELARYGVLKTLAQIEADELCPETLPPTSSESTGSTTGATGSRRASGRSQPTSPGLDRSSIAALTRAA